jgi:aldose 1-epimerase
VNEDAGKTEARLHTLRSSRGIEACVTNYGCAIVSLKTPDRHGLLGNIVLGFGRLDEYFDDALYTGVVVGRYAGRIANARFDLDGSTHLLSANAPPHHLHGGFRGFNRQIWQTLSMDGSRAHFRRVSPAGEEGYPGTLTATVTYALSDDELRIEYEGTTDAPTHVNMTQHSYFNLHETGDVREHRLMVRASYYLPATTALIPTGAIADVTETPFDFRHATAIGARRGGRYDHAFVIDPASQSPSVAARLFDPGSGRSMEIQTTEPGLQVYCGDDTRGICLETQHHPDSPNQPGFPSTVLRPGARYRSVTAFVFGIDGIALSSADLGSRGRDRLR